MGMMRGMAPVILAQMPRSMMRAEDIVAPVMSGKSSGLLVPEITMWEARPPTGLCGTVAEHEFPAAAGIRHLTVSVGLRPGIQRGSRRRW